MFGVPKRSEWPTESYFLTSSCPALIGPALCGPKGQKFGHLNQLEHLLPRLQKQVSEWDSVNKKSRGDFEKMSDQNARVQNV